MCTALEQIGFTVKIVKNASLESMNDALSDFEATLKESGGTGFFHYGGHAVQVEGKNYLIPSTADIPDERRVKTRALNVDEVMNSMSADTNIVILDSCRNNPLPSGSGRSASRGLVISSVRPKNSIIVYSAEAGCTAQDGVFTPVLTKEITRKDVSFQAMLINVRKEVQRLTNGTQIPGEYSQMTEIVYLAGKSAEKSINPIQKNDTVTQNNTGTLCITSVVDSDIYLNGKKAGKLVASKPFLLQNMSLGTHQVELRSSIGKSMRTVYINENEIADVNFKTKRIKIDDGWSMGKIWLVTLGSSATLGGILSLGLGLGLDESGATIAGGVVGGAGLVSLIIGLVLPNSFHYETRFVSALEKDPVLKNICFATNGIQTTVGYRFNF
ncbi:MAG: caspase family protein [Treponema sp.]|nr:caspase family protein [Treponema sp.]